MKHALIALVSLSAAPQSPPTPAEAASQAAVQAFNEACVQGQFRLSPERGRILKNSEETDFTDILFTSNMTRHDIVKLNYPPESYLIFAQWGHRQANSTTSECILLSRSITKHDAMAALMTTVPGEDPKVDYQMIFPAWIIDQPKKGFFSRMYIKEGGTIVLEVGMYNKS